MAERKLKYGHVRYWRRLAYFQFDMAGKLVEMAIGPFEWWVKSRHMLWRFGAARDLIERSING